jgi:hypothetical protein
MLIKMVCCWIELARYIGICIRNDTIAIKVI